MKNNLVNVWSELNETTGDNNYILGHSVMSYHAIKSRMYLTINWNLWKQTSFSQSNFIIRDNCPYYHFFILLLTLSLLSTSKKWTISPWKCIKFLHMSFGNYLVKIVIKKLTCQIWCIFKEKWFIFFLKSEALRSESVERYTGLNL